MTKPPQETIDNTPFEKFEGVVDEAVWAKFCMWPHKQLDGENGWDAGQRELENHTEVITLKSGDLYWGSVEAKSQLPDGFGVLASKKTKSIHQGFFLNGEPNGSGVSFPGSGPQVGWTIIGNFSKGKMNGKCKYENAKNAADGSQVSFKFEGEFVAGVKSGYGKEFNEKGDSYEGQYAKDKKEGRGKQKIQATGTIYEGTWVNDLKQGNFKVTASDKVTFKVFAKDQPTSKTITEDDYNKTAQ